MGADIRTKFWIERTQWGILGKKVNPKKDRWAWIKSMVLIRCLRVSQCLFKSTIPRWRWRKNVREKSPLKSWGARAFLAVWANEMQPKVNRRDQSLHISWRCLSTGSSHHPFHLGGGLFGLFKWWRRQRYLQISSIFSYHWFDDVSLFPKESECRLNIGSD